MNAAPQTETAADAAETTATPAHHRAFARTRVLAGLPSGGSSLTASGVTTTVSVPSGWPC